MKPILIVENNTNPLRENVKVSGGKKEYLLGGIFTEFGVKNRNERIYTAEKFIPCLKELNERINTMGVVYGEFDHPDVFDTSLSRSSHIVRNVKFVKEANRVEGQIKLLNTYWGKEAKALVEDNLKKAAPMDALLATEEGLTSPGFGFCASSEKGGSN